MGNLVQNAKQAGSKGRSHYTLAEDLYIQNALDNGNKSLKEISAVTGRPVNGLRVRYKEGEITNSKGEKVIRSLRRFNTVEELFAYHKVEYTGPEQVEALINEFAATVNANTGVA